MVEPGVGAERLDASGVDFRYIPTGMWWRHDAILSPKIRTSRPDLRSCAAIESPYGPAPTIATSLIRLLSSILGRASHRLEHLVDVVGHPHVTRPRSFEV